MKSLTGLQRAIIPDQTSWIIYQPNCWSRYWQRKKRMSHIIKQGIYQTTVTHAKPLKIFLSFWVAFHIQPLLIIKGSVKRRESESIIFLIYFQNRLTNDDLWTSTRQASFFLQSHEMIEWDKKDFQCPVFQFSVQTNILRHLTKKNNSWNDYFLHRAFFPCFLKTKIELDGHETFVLMDQTFRWG